MCYNAFSDEELIAKLRRGENEVTDYILEKYKPLVRKRTNAMYLMGGETEDLIQEGMIGLFKAIRDYQEEREASFYHFAELCINRQLYSALQASNRKKHQPLNTYISFSDIIDVQLDENHPGVFSLFYADDYSDYEDSDIARPPEPRLFLLLEMMYRKD